MEMIPQDFSLYGRGVKIYQPRAEKVSTSRTIFAFTMDLQYCVYVLFSEKDCLLYIGFSGDLANRIERHHSGGVTSTAPRRPLKLIFCEHYLYKEDALNREAYFKTTMGKKALKLMLSDTLRKLGYKGSMIEKNLPIIYE
jgi:putative endonuclease